jgi:hypothetical protein
MILLSKKGFNSTLIQGIIDAKCSFWDYDYGWVGSIHVRVRFQKIDVGSCVMKDKFYLIS